MKEKEMTIQSHFLAFQAFTTQLSVVERKLEKQFAKRMQRLDSVAETLSHQVARLGDEFAQNRTLVFQRLSASEVGIKQHLVDLQVSDDHKLHFHSQKSLETHFHSLTTHRRGLLWKLKSKRKQIRKKLPK